jgi:hypothetical protein
MQRLLADKKMKKRWKVPYELQLFAPYEAGDDKSHREAIMELEHILKKYKVWPNDRHMEKVKSKSKKQAAIQEKVVDEVKDEENKKEMESVEPVNTVPNIKRLSEKE